MELFYRKLGSGVPMVIVHGLYGVSDNWLSTAKALAVNFEVYLIDQRNHGRSPHRGQHTYENMRDDLLGFLKDMGLDSAVLMGHSMGGKTIMCFAQHHPERVRSLIVVDIAPKSYKDAGRKEPLSHYGIMRAMKEVDFSVAKSRRDVDRMLGQTIKQERIRRFLMKNLRQEEGKKYSWALNLDVLMRELDNIMDGVNEKCFDPAFPVTGIPVLFIRGADSRYILDEDMDFIQGIFPFAELETIPGAGHWVHAEQPEAFVNAVTKFVLG